MQASFPDVTILVTVVFYGMALELTLQILHRWKIRTLLLILVITLLTAVGLNQMDQKGQMLNGLAAGYAEGALWLLVSLTGLGIFRRRGLRGVRRRNASTAVPKQKL